MKKSEMYKCKTLIFGCGKNGIMCYDILKDYIEIIGFVDNDTAKQNQKYSGLPIYSVSELSKKIMKEFDKDIVVIVSLSDRIQANAISFQLSTQCGLKLGANIFYAHDYIENLPNDMFIKMQREFESPVSIEEKYKSVFVLERKLNRYNDEIFNSYHKNEAEDYLRSIESVKGKTDSRTIRLCDEYAADVLGWEGYSPWLQVYSAVAGEFLEGWIPDNYYGKVVIPILKNEYGLVSQTRSLATKIFGTKYFPDIAHYANGFFADNSFEKIPVDRIKNYIFGKRDKVVYKLNDSTRGRGAVVYTESNFNTDEIISAGNGVFQDYIEQHSFFDKFSTASVATIRLTSVIDKYGVPSCRAAFLRIGAEADPVVIWEKNTIVSINLNNGALSKNGYLPNMRPVDLNYGENDFIPCFDKCVKAVEELHAKMTFNHCIGWDMIIDKNDDVKIMEWNGIHNDIKFHEAISGPCFSDLGWENLWKNT